MSLYNSLIIKFLAAIDVLSFQGKIMAPFPEVMLGVRCGWQQFFKNVVGTVPNFRKQSFISIVIVPRLSWQTPTNQIEQFDVGMSRCAGDQQTSKSPTTLEQRR